MTSEEREAILTGYESMINFLRQNPELPPPTEKEFKTYSYGHDSFAAAVKSLGTCKKEFSEYYASAVVEFGPIKYGFYTSRDSVCERVVVGKKLVPLQPSTYYPEIPEHEEDVVEWRCGKFLGDENEDAPTQNNSQKEE